MDLMDYRRKIIASSPHLSHAEGAVASFADGTDLPLKSLVVNIEPLQSGTGDPSPSNIRPISGWDAVGVHDTGINVWDEDWEVGGINNQTGEPTSHTDRIRSKNFCACLPSTSYYGYITGSISGFATYVWFYDANKEFISGRSASKVAFTTPNNAYYFKISTYGGGYVTYNYDISINYPSTDHDYHPYIGTTLTVQLGRTVYGGTLNVLTGELVVYPYYASYNGETLTGRWVSDRDKYVAGTTPTIGAQVVDMSGTGTTYTLDPQTVRSLVGQNNIFADTGNVALEYWANPIT